MRTDIAELARNIDNEALKYERNLFGLTMMIGVLDTTIGGLTHRKDEASILMLDVAVKEREQQAARASDLRSGIAKLDAVAGLYNWNRAWIVVTNGRGHVHKTTSCNTCFTTTRFQLLPQCSALTEEEIVEFAGERACTVCYPSAPIEVRSRPTQLFSLDEELAAKLRAEQRAKSDAKDAKRVTTTYEGHIKIYSTVRSALLEAAGDYARAIIVARWDREGWQNNVEDKLKDVRNILLAVAAHPDAEGKTFEALFAEMQEKATKKYLAEVRKFGTPDASAGWYITAADAVSRVEACATATK